MEPQDYSERISLAPVIGLEEKGINGITEVAFTIQKQQPRAILIIGEWLSADNLLVKFVGDNDFTTISAAAAQVLGQGAIYTFAITSFKSSAVNEINFRIAALY